MKRLGVYCLFWVLLIAAASVRAAETPRYGGRVVLGIRNDISSLNPFIRTSSTNFYVRNIPYEALLDFDRNGKLVPALAESWDVSADGRTYTFRLRRGVRFHDGKEMTAEDVKWSADYAVDRKNAATGLTMLGSVEGVRVKDKYTVEILLKQREVAFLNIVGTVRPFPIVPAGSVPTGQRTMPAFPPGTGPFVFKEYKTGREIVFVRHKNYWQKGLPYLDEVVLKPVLEDQVRFTSVRAGDLDMIERTPYSMLAKLLKGEFPDLRSAEAKYAAYRRVIFNVADPPFNNLKLRQAVLYAFDRKKYIDGAFWGFGEPTEQLFPKESPWHVQLGETKRDPDKVRALLKEAGAEALEIEIAGQKAEEDELQVLHQLLSSAGIKTKVVILERAAREDRERRGDFMMVLSGSDIPADPAEEFPSEYGCNEEEVKAKRRTENSIGYCNKEVDRLVDEAGKITDHKKRYELYSRVTRILRDEIPDISLAFVPRFFTYHKKVQGFETDWDGRFNMTTAGFSRVWVRP